MAQQLPLEVSTALIGAAGEHYVLYRLFKRGLRAGRPPEGTPEVDLLILDERRNVIVSLQVKTRANGTDGGWHMRAKHENIESPRILYAFVDLEQEHPACFIIPSHVVAKFLRLDHGAWLATPGKKGQKHNDSPMRRIRPYSEFTSSEFPRGWMDEYLERWDLLESLID